MNESNITNIYTILTEEPPCINEIGFILSKVIYIEPTLLKNMDIIPQNDNNKFEGEWQIKFDKYLIYIKLFKGNTSCVDYLLFEGIVNVKTTDASNAICVLESTKTSDTDSRNTSVNQRITKFMVYKKMYPNSKARMIMYYNRKWTNRLTNTAIFGLKLMKSLKIEAFHDDENLHDAYHITPFESLEELIHEKNSIKEKKGNISVKIRCENDIYYISCKLDKGKTTNSGKISHDPNVGLLSGIINYIYNNNILCEIIIENHNIRQDYFDKKPESKFWYATHEINVKFVGVNIIKIPCLPNKYFTIENEVTEKMATILYAQLINKEYSCIFSNHSGCALTNIITSSNDVTVERSMQRPDIVFYHKINDEILIIEGKIEKDIYRGIAQLNDKHLDKFIKLIKTHYPTAIIKKGLCITIDSIKNLKKYNLDFPILFAIDNSGCYTL